MDVLSHTLPYRYCFLVLLVMTQVTSSVAAMRRHMPPVPSALDTVYHLVLVRKIDQKPKTSFESGDEIAIRLKGSMHWISGKLEEVKADFIVFEGKTIHTQAIQLIRPIPSPEKKQQRRLYLILGFAGYLVGLGMVFLSLPFGTSLLLLGLGITLVGAIFLALANQIRPIYRIGWWFQLRHESL